MNVKLMKKYTLSIFRWAKLGLRGQAHCSPVGFLSLADLTPAGQEGRLKPSPTLEATRAVHTNAPLPNRSFGGTVGRRYLAAPLVEGVLLPVVVQAQDQPLQAIEY